MRTITDRPRRNVSDVERAFKWQGQWAAGDFTRIELLAVRGLLVMAIKTRRPYVVSRGNMARNCERGTWGDAKRISADESLVARRSVVVTATSLFVTIGLRSILVRDNDNPAQR